MNAKVFDDMMEVLKLLLTSLFFADVALAQNGQLQFRISTDGTFNISIGGNGWFPRSGPVKVRWQGKCLSTADGSLILNDSYSSSFTDHFGYYEYFGFDYHDKSGEFHFTTFVKSYDTVNALVFGHRFVSGTEMAALPSADHVISSFPSIRLDEMSLQRGYVTYDGNSK